MKVAGKKAKVEQRPVPYTPLEELQVMMSLVKLIEEHNNSTEQQFYMFEALFGGCIGTIKVSVLYLAYSYTWLEPQLGPEFSVQL